MRCKMPILAVATAVASQSTDISIVSNCTFISKLAATLMLQLL